MLIHIFLDANFLLVPSQLLIDIYSEFERLIPKPWEIIVISAIFTELEKKISDFPNSNKLKKEYKLAQELLEQNQYILMKKERKQHQAVDDLLIEQLLLFQKEEKFVYLATNDKKLRNKCKLKKIPTIYIRQNKKLDCD